MDRRYIDDHHIIARYLADQLGDEDRTAFEEYYLEHPDVVQELEAAARFKAALMSLQERGELARLMQPAPWYRQPKYATAAALILATSIVVGLLLQGRRDRPVLMAAEVAALYDGGAPLRVLATGPILRRRSAFFDGTLQLPGTAMALELKVLPNEPTPGAVYHATLAMRATDDTRQSIGQVSGVTADASGYVTLYVNSSGLRAGEYVLRLDKEGASDATEDAGSYTIAVRSAAAGGD